MVITGELHHQRLGSEGGELCCRESAMVEVKRAATPHGKGKLGSGADEDPTDQSQASVALANVVNQSRPHHMPLLADAPSGLVPMALIGPTLGKESLLLGS